MLEPLLPATSTLGRPPIWTRRQLINAIWWRIRTAALWRDVPERCGSWQSIYGPFRGWQRSTLVRRSAHRAGSVRRRP
nr:transposase [Pseudonocardia sp. MH-G8]